MGRNAKRILVARSQDDIEVRSQVCAARRQAHVDRSAVGPDRADESTAFRAAGSPNQARTIVAQGGSPGASGAETAVRSSWLRARSSPERAMRNAVRASPAAIAS